MPLNLNIEIKARLADIEALTVKAKSLADQGPIEILQDDTFFACATGRLKLRMFSDGRGELIFYRRGNETGPKESSYVRAPTAVPETLRERGAGGASVDGATWGGAVGSDRGCLHRPDPG